jgi:hypothetical protein
MYRFITRWPIVLECPARASWLAFFSGPERWLSPLIVMAGRQQANSSTIRLRTLPVEPQRAIRGVA